MTNYTQEIWNFLASEPSIRKELDRGIVNTMALARHIIKEKQLDCSVDGAITSIRRYVAENKAKLNSSKTQQVLASSRVSTKNRIALIAMKRENRIIEMLPNVFPYIELNRGDVMRLSEGKESIKLLVDEKNAKKIAEVFPRESIIEIRQNLSELSVNFGSASQDSVGAIAAVMNEFASGGIKIEEVIGCLPEFMVFVDAKDILKSYEILTKLCE